ncbi:MAG: LysE family translocator [Neomegalonema sp.]|nr:LysE family translocator [Neomegalonema sp.]
MFELTQLITFSLAAFVVIIAPGLVVTIVVANALRYGAAAGLWNVLGAQAGHLLLVAIVALGLDAIAASFASIFEWVRIVGAAYLIWLGVRMIRAGLAPKQQAQTQQTHTPPPARGFFSQGFLVAVSNPKTLLFFGAFLPQFVRPEAGSAAAQAVLLGLLFTVIAGVCDSAYALAAGRAGGWMQRRQRAVSAISGLFMTFGGVWMALRGRV